MSPTVRGVATIVTLRQSRVAQLAEHSTVNRRVAGSSLAAGAMDIPGRPASGSRAVSLTGQVERVNAAQLSDFRGSVLVWSFHGCRWNVVQFFFGDKVRSGEAGPCSNARTGWAR